MPVVWYCRYTKRYGHMFACLSVIASLFPASSRMQYKKKHLTHSLNQYLVDIMVRCGNKWIRPLGRATISVWSFGVWDTTINIYYVMSHKSPSRFHFVQGSEGRGVMYRGILKVYKLYFLRAPSVIGLFNKDNINLLCSALGVKVAPVHTLLLKSLCLLLPVIDCACWRLGLRYPQLCGYLVV